jgi:hypothetical protein
MIYKRNIELVVKKKKKINIEKKEEEKQEKEELNENILPNKYITYKKSENIINISSESKIIQELDNISLEYRNSEKCLFQIRNDLNMELTKDSIKQPSYLNTFQVSYSYKLYQLYIFIITFINKYNIYIFFLIIFILLFNNYFIKPT